MNYKLYSSALSGSGSGWISHLLSGTIRFRSDTKNAIWFIPSDTGYQLIIKLELALHQARQYSTKVGKIRPNESK